MARKLCHFFRWYPTLVLYHPFKVDNGILRTSKVRLSSTAPVKKIVPEGPIYIKTDHEYKISKKAAVRTLENLLGVKNFTALEILSNNKDLMKTTSALMKSNYSLYLKNNVNNETLIKYPALLAITNLELKLSVIEQLAYDTKTVAVLLLLPLNMLKKLVEEELQHTKETGRIAIIAKLLQVDVETACEFMSKKTFLCSLPMARIEKNVKILTDFGISIEDIHNDLWVLRYCEETIQSRLMEAKKFNVDTVKTWMVRVQPEIFQNYIKRRSDNKSILGDNSLTEYLSERLECSIEIANYLILKQPALKNKSLKKLKELIDFLYAAGFQSHHICRVPKILVHSVETIRKRLKQLSEKNIQIDSLHMLTKSQKQFTQYYEALLKSKNKQRSKS